MAESPKLLDQVREKFRAKHYAIRTETACSDWIERYIYFHDKTHPKDLGTQDVEIILSALVTEHNLSARESPSLLGGNISVKSVILLPSFFLDLAFWTAYFNMVTYQH